MRKSEWIESLVGIEAMDTTQWLSVDTSYLNPEKTRKFKCRKRAVDLYLQNEDKISQITEKTGISRSELYRLLTRVFSLSENGFHQGYTALLPGYRVSKYKRITNSHFGTAGLFTQFLKEYPELETKLNKWATANNNGNGEIISGTNFLTIWRAFEKACKETSIDTYRDYPFSSADRGREAIRRYCRQVRKKNFIRGSIVEYGRSAGKMAAYASKNFQTNIIQTPYHHVQIDGHRIDTELVVTLNDADGIEREYPLSRLWLIVLIDLASRAVLGYHISLSENYTAEDVLECIGNSLVPWKPKTLPSPRIHYRPGGGLPSGVIDNCAWRTFDILQFDNAMPHLSAWVQERIIQHVCNEVITNRPGRPRSDAIVERFMRTFEEDSLHKFPTTTGSHPKDPRRHKPEEFAKWLRIGFDDLVIITDLTIANYNASPHTSLHGWSPLEYLRYHIKKNNDLIRTTITKDSERSPLFLRKFKVTIRGDQKNGHLPYIQFLGARYKSNELCLHPEYIGQSVVFEVNVKDIRSATVYLNDGRSLGTIFAQRCWRRHPHSIQVRRAIVKLMRLGSIQRSSFNPVGAYLIYLNERAKMGRRERNNLLKSQNETHIANDELNKLPSYESRPSLVKVRDWVSLDKISD